MTPFQSACVVIFGILAYLMWVDENVAIYLTLIFKIMRVNTERMLWMIRFHPVILFSPIGKWWMMRKYMRTVRELSQELSQKDSDGV